MLNRYALISAAASLVALSSAAHAATSTVNYAAIVRANQKAVDQINAINASCTDTAACKKQTDKILRSVQFRINNYTTNDAALTPAVERGTIRQLNEIFQRQLTCTTAACTTQNTKTLGSLIYRITNQPPISPT